MLVAHGCGEECFDLVQRVGHGPDEESLDAPLGIGSTPVADHDTLAIDHGNDDVALRAAKASIPQIGGFGMAVSSSSSWARMLRSCAASSSDKNHRGFCRPENTSASTSMRFS